MKKCDIKRLEKVVAKYMEIEKLLDAVENNAYNSGERFNHEATVLQLVREMSTSAIRERKWVEGKIRAFNDYLEIK